MVMVMNIWVQCVLISYKHSQTVLPCLKDTLLAMNNMPSSTAKQDGALGPASSCPQIRHAAMGRHTAEGQ